MESPTFKSTRSKVIQWSFVVSVILSLVVLGLEAAGSFAAPWFFGGAPTILTIIHHVTLLSLMIKQGQRDVENREQPVFTTLGTIICAWLLFVQWAMLFALYIVMIVLHLRMPNSNYDGLLPDVDNLVYAALPICIIEFVVVFTVSFICTWERHAYRAFVLRYARISGDNDHGGPSAGARHELKDLHGKS